MVSNGSATFDGVSRKKSVTNKVVNALSFETILHRRVRHGILTDFGGYSLEVIRPVDFDEIDLPGFGVGRRIQLYRSCDDVSDDVTLLLMTWHSTAVLNSCTVQLYSTMDSMGTRARGWR